MNFFRFFNDAVNREKTSRVWIRQLHFFAQKLKHELLLIITNAASRQETSQYWIFQDYSSA